MEPRLVPAGPDDLEIVRPLVRAYHDFEGVIMTEATRDRALAPLLEAESPPGFIRLVVVEGEIVGYAAVCFGFSIEFGGRDAFLDELYLEPEQRGRGLGARVLEALHKELAELGIRALHLEVARDNARGKALYRKLGFEDRARYQLMSVRLEERN